MKTIISMFALALSLNTMAYVSSFTFDVESDIGEIWVCGAALNETTELGLFDAFSGGNFLKANVNGEAVTLSPTLDQKNVRIGPRKQQYDLVSKDNKEIISELTFFLGSEYFGAKYKVRVCWEGPDFDTQEVANNNVFTSNYGAFTYVATVADDDNYTSAARLSVNSQWNCEKYDSTGLSKFIPNIDNLGKIDSAEVSAPSYSAGVLELNSAILTKCIATFTFSENTYGPRLGDQSASINITAGLFRRD